MYDNWKYYVNFGYNIKNLNLRLNIYNPFGSKWTTIQTVSTEYFSQRQQAYSCFASNRFALTAIYTLSYGKKVSRTTLQKASMMESGAMSAE
ncbi:MAG: hypothetical protein K2J82_02555 [Muribaculaceae bacterium]|nr:hypothetical protein [Muribaculaceae bacterium]MDE6753472.1 hypothetical protein [Muribaculaceae bacterium]